MTIGSGKRAAENSLAEEEEPLLKSWAQQQASASEYWQTTPWRGQGLASAPNYASGTGPSPSSSSGESKSPLLSTSGGTELSWNPEGKPKLIQPGTSTEIQPASSSNAKSVSFAPSKKVLSPSGEIYTDMLQPEKKPPQLSITGGTEPSSNPEGEARLIQPGTSTEIQPASFGKAKSVSFAPSKKVFLPSGEISIETLQSEKKPPQLSITGGTKLSSKPENEAKLIQPGISTEIQPALSSKAKSVSFSPEKVVLPPSCGIYTELPQPVIIPPPSLPPGPEGYQPKIAVQPTKPKSKSMLRKLVSKLKFKFPR